MIKTMKQKVFVILISSVVLTSIVFLITLNVVITSYIRSNANEAISNQIAMFQNIDYYFDTVDEQLEEAPLFTVSSFSLDNDFTFSIEDAELGDYYYYLSKDDIAIQDYFKNSPALYEDGKIFSVKIEEQRFTIGTQTIEWGSEYGEPVNENLIFYVNETPLYRIIHILNWMFLLILGVSVVGAIFAGLKAGQMIENSELKLKKFFANASHELKTPLMSIQGYAEGLQTGVISDTNLVTNVIIKQSDKMYALVEELLYLSKIESGEFVFCKHKIDLNLFIEDCFASVAGMATQKGIHICLDCPNQPIVILGDETQLQKAFMNIISNALRYAKSSIDVNISVSLRKIEIAITDDGKGISEQDMPHIFERFYAGEQGNTGIGLSLAKEIISLHKGTIRAENECGGAKFIVTLPKYL